MQHSRSATLYALGAIASWALLAALGVALKHVPPFLLTGIALVVGSVPTWPLVARRPGLWKIPLGTLALGVTGLFGFHFLLFLALRSAPPVQANLVNYLWPLFIVVLSPLLLPGMVLRPVHVLAALLGVAGAGDTGLLVAGVMLVGIGAGAEFDIAAFLVSRYFGLRDYGRLFGVHLGLITLASTVAPWLFGQLYRSSGSYDAMLMVCGSVFLAGGLSLLALGRYPRYSALPTPVRVPP